LKNEQLEDIRILQQECEREGFTLKLNWETLRSRNGVHKNDFLHYDGLKLVGFLGLYDFGNKAEMCGMVHPDYRGVGLGKWLMDCLSEHPDVVNVSQQLLRTRDAHGLYEQYGYTVCDAMVKRSDRD